MLKYIKEILKVALPAVGEMVLYMLIWFFDTMMVGNYGGQLGVSAVALSSELLYTFINILMGMGLSIALTSIIARTMGNKNISLAQNYANQGIKIGILISFIVTSTFFIFAENILSAANAEKEILNKNISLAQNYANQGIKIGILISFIVTSTFFIFAENILSAANAEKEILATSAAYMRICCSGMFFYMCANMLNGIFRGCKDTKTPLYGAVIMNIVNLSFDYLLIFGKFGFPELGIRGAAAATAGAQILYFLFIFSQRKKLPFKISLFEKINFREMKDLIKLAVPSAMQEGAYSISRLLGVLMVMRLGSLSFSANQIAVTIESISFMPGWGFAIACTALVGHSIGGRNFRQAKNYANASAFISAVVMGFFSLIFLLFSEELISMFIKKDDIGGRNFRQAKNYANASAFISAVVMGFFSLIFLLFSEELISMFIKKDEIEVIKLGSMCLMIGAAQQIPMAVDMVLAGALKGSGDTKTPFNIAFICNWGIRLPLMFYFIYMKKMPITYFWIITVIQWFIESGILIYKYRKKFNNWGIRLPLMFYFIYMKKMPITYFWIITVIQWFIESGILIYKYRKKFKKMIQKNK